MLVTLSLLVTSGIYNAYALFYTGDVVLVTFNLDAARGFEKVGRIVSNNAPEFVLEQGKTGIVTMTLTSGADNNTISIPSMWYGGSAASNYSSWNDGRDLPEGITFSVLPQNLTLAPGSNATVSMRISAAPNAAIRIYNLAFAFEMNSKALNPGGISSAITILRIVEGNTSSTLTNTTCTNSYANRTVTTIVTSTRTITVTSSSNNLTTQTLTTAATTPNLSVTTSTPTIMPTTLTSTITAISIERVTEPSIYAWAIGATVVAVILAVVTMMRKK